MPTISGGRGAARRSGGRKNRQRRSVQSIIGRRRRDARRSGVVTTRIVIPRRMAVVKIAFGRHLPSSRSHTPREPHRHPERSRAICRSRRKTSPPPATCSRSSPRSRPAPSAPTAAADRRRLWRVSNGAAPRCANASDRRPRPNFASTVGRSARDRRRRSSARSPTSAR